MLNIYAINIDKAITVEPSGFCGFYGGIGFELFDRCEDESDQEMINAGYVRVSCPELDGIETKWAELYEINQGRKLLGLLEVGEGDICA